AIATRDGGSSIVIFHRFYLAFARLAEGYFSPLPTSLTHKVHDEVFSMLPDMRGASVALLQRRAMP
ncbi:MAG: hypothetical protein ACXIUO_12565, partial [Erythrobacter sp.]